MLANLLKELIHREAVETTVAKAKEVRRHADRLVTMAKDGTLASRRRAIAALMVRHNHLTSKEARQARSGDLSSYNTDRHVVRKLFEELGPRFKERQGGYTRLVRTRNRVGDDAQLCILEFVG
jgi:large subunit ribosomal protein L17